MGASQIALKICEVVNVLLIGVKVVLFFLKKFPKMNALAVD